MSAIARFKNKAVKALLFVVGCLSVVLGVIGIFLPVMPTTPFLLLAAACFMRTSPRFYNWLVGHPRLGKYLVYYLEGKGIPLKAKVYTIALMAISMSFTTYFVPFTAVKILLPLVGVLVALYIVRQPTLDLSLEVKD
ncbi:MAG: YbaN family protein [Oleispira antarctica]|nr:YbaN family protein [Oleispira antarctica]MBQ0791365.1 YbaN family protein [Oleispira antarctica]